MGVKGLWRLLLPIGRRISIESLEGKILAVDASIWLTQFVKAMRDPETGRVQPAAHLIGFIRRLCKLRYQGIRPVFVFDGATPEIKSRELRARRKRRDQLFSNDDDDGTNAMQRMAKRLLVQQLKKQGTKSKFKSKLSVITEKTKKKGNNRGKDNQETAAVVGLTTANSSYAPGFYDPQAAVMMEEEEEEEKKENKQNKNRSSTRSNPKRQEEEEEEEETKVAETINLNESEIIELLEEDHYLETDVPEGPSDWDVVVIDTNDAEEKGGSTEQITNNKNKESSHTTDTDIRGSHAAGGQKSSSSDEWLFDADHVAGLPSTQRKDRVEDAKRRRRMESRREFMQVAYDPEGLSKCQLQNFLRSTKLNKDIQRMAVQVTKNNEESNHHEGGRLASDRTRRIVFEKDTDDKMEVQKKHKERVLQKYSKKRGLSIMSTSSRSDDDSDVEWEDANDSSAGVAAARPRAIVDDDDDDGTDSGDDDDDDIDTGTDQNETVGFFVSSSITGRVGPSKRVRRPVVQEAGDEAPPEQSNNTRHDAKLAQELHDESLARALQNAESDGDDDEGAGGGGFIKAAKSAPLSSRKADHRLTISIDSDDDDGDKKMPAKMSKDEILAQKLQDENLARALQSSEYSSDDDEGGGGFLPAADSTNNLKVAQKPQYYPSQEEQDEIIARQLQEQEDQVDRDLHQLADSDTETDAGFLQTPRTTGRGDGGFLPMITKPTSYDNDTDEDDGGGGFLPAESDEKYLNGHTNSRQADDAVNTIGGAGSNILGDSKGTPINSKVEESDDEDDVDWEDGDCDDETENAPDVARVDGEHDVEMINDGNKIQNIRGISIQPEPVDLTEDDDGDDEGGVDWADGNNEMEAPDSRHGKTKEAKHLNLAQHAAMGAEHDVTIDEMEDVVVENEEDEPTDNPWRDDFNKATTTSSEDVAAALEHAQATAANLTNWAGRAFRRAVAQHAQENGLVVPEAARLKATNVDETGVTESTNHELAASASTASANAAAKKPHSKSPIKQPRVSESSPKIGDAQISPWPEALDGEAVMQSLEAYQEKWTGERNQQERDMDTVTDEMRTEVMELLQLFGVPYVEAPAEAEAQCVELEKLGLVDGVVTEDSDAFVFGGQCVYKNIFDDQKYVEVYLAKDAEKEMNLTLDGMVALAMLLGGDYTEGIKGVGIVNGMEIIQTFDVSQDLNAGLARFRQWLDGFDPTDVIEIQKGKTEMTKEHIFHRKHHTARTRWIAPKHFPDPKVLTAYLNPVVDTSKERFSWGVPDLERLIHFCNRYVGWSPDETRKLLQPVVEKLESGSMRQTRIDSFMSYEDGIKFADVRSKRLREVLDDVQKEKKQKMDSTSST
jgi:5'-3' exonuclease